MAEGSGEAPAARAEGSAASKQAGEGGSDNGFGSRLVEVGLQMLPALVGAVGFVGFVAVAGAAIQWIRFSAAGLPADQAVGVIERPELVTIGGNFLIIYTLAGAGAVLLVYLLDPRGEASRQTRMGLATVVALEMLAAFLVVGGWKWWGYLFASAWVAAVWASSLAALTWVAIRVNALKGRQRQRTHLRNLAAAVLAAEEEARRAAAERDAYRQAIQPDLDDTTTPPGRPRLGEEERATLVSKLAARERRATLAARERNRLRREFEALRKELGPKAFASPLGIDPENAPEKPHEVLSVLDEQEGLEPAAISPKGLRQSGRTLSSSAVTHALAVALTVISLGATTVMVALGDPSRLWLAPLWLLALLLAWMVYAWFRTAAGPVTAAVLFVAGLLTLAAFDETAWLIPVLAIIAILGLVNLGLASATRQFAWYAVAVFLSVPIFGAALTIARTLRTPKVQPAALVRTSDAAGMCGIYVTETDERVYLARVDHEPFDENEPAGGTGRLFWVPSDDVDVLKIGVLQGLCHAEDRARGLMAELDGDRAEPDAPAGDDVTAAVEMPLETGAKLTVTRKGKRPTPASSAAPAQPPAASEHCAAALPPPNSAPFWLTRLLTGLSERMRSTTPPP
jgi:hypothetical protein